MKFSTGLLIVSTLLGGCALAAQTSTAPARNPIVLVSGAGLVLDPAQSAAQVRICTGPGTLLRGMRPDAGAAAIGGVFDALGCAAIVPDAGVLALGAERVAQIVLATRTPWLAANAVRTADRQPLGRTSCVVEALGRKLGIIGLATGRSSEGIRLDESEASLGPIVAELAPRTSFLILAGELDLAEAAKLARRFPAVRIILRTNAQGSNAAPVRVGDAWVLACQASARVLARTTIQLDDDGRITDLAHEIEEQGSEVPAALTAALGACGRVLEPPVFAAARSRAAARDGGFRECATGNRACALTIRACEVRASYGAASSSGGKVLVLDSEWRNTIPLALVYEQQVPTSYRVKNLADHVYVVANGKTLCRLLPNAQDLPGHVPVRDLELARIGATLRGNLVFDAPGETISTLELRYYDYAHGHMVLPLLGKPGDPPKPLAATLRNEVLELGAFGLRREKRFLGHDAPEGMTFVRVELRATSLFTTEADAQAFDSKATKGQKTMVGTVADWKESRRYAQLVVDGEHAYLPLSESELGAEPRFLPDAMTGGDLVFSAPESCTSLELRCDFPNARSSTGGDVFRPKGITLQLFGQRPTLGERPQLVEIADDGLRVAVLAQRCGDRFAQTSAAAGERMLVWTVSVLNTGAKGELLQPKEQLRCVRRTGEQQPLDPASYSGLHPPADPLWIPGGERRTFEVAFRIAADEQRPRLAYRGLTLAKIVELPALAGTVDAAGTDPRAPIAAESRPIAPATGALVDGTKPLPTGPVPVPVPVPALARGPEAAAVPPVKREAKGIAGVGLTPEKVNESIDRGAAFLWAWLKDKDLKGREQLGDAQEHWIAALALVHAGAHKKFPDFDAALRTFLATVDPLRGNAYQAGITCMLVESYGDPSFLPALRTAARWLLEVQGPEGSWTYTRSLPAGVLRDPAEDQVIQVSGGVPLDGGEATAAVARITPWKEGQDGDNSVSQYALLGLQSAARAGVPVDAEVWKRSLASFRSRQGDDGNWYYNGRSGTGYGSMTCAGICSVAIARHELGETEPAADGGIDKGLQWLGRNFSLTQHPQQHPPEKWRFYYLYSLERVGRVLGADFIGDHEWYPEGAQHLVSTQLGNGSWLGEWEEADPRLATSFALLFLTRSTPSLAPRALARGGNGVLKTGIQLPRGNRYYVILDASGSMLAEMDGKTKWQIARDAVARLVEELAEGSQVALRVYGHRKTAIEADASDDTALEIPLKALVKQEFLAKLQSLRPRGKTPLARSLLEAKRDLASAAASDPVTVILLTDGGEDTLPRQDPLRAAAEFGALKGVRLHVIGFDIGREDWSTQLQAIAEQAQGSYWPALKAEDLAAELRSAVFGVPAGFVVLDRDGKQVAREVFGKEVPLPEGRYVFRTSYGGADHDQGLWINTGRTTSVVFNAAKAVQLKPVPGGPKKAAAAAPAPQPETGAGRPAPETAKPKFCSGCGKPVKPDASFCPDCGTKVKQ